MIFENIALLNSITDAAPAHVGTVGISGSHGGIFAATVASRAGLLAVALNDAGHGLEDAGIAGVIALDQVGMAGVTVSAQSAEIGSAEDSLNHGVISFANTCARTLGLEPGVRLYDGVPTLQRALRPTGVLPEMTESRWVETIGSLEVLCVDSASAIRPADAGRIIVTGSHGGLIGGDASRACKADARLAVFNDAGGGRNGIGFTRLPALQSKGIAALTLDCNSCRIGDARSALETGAVSRVNATAAKMGFAPGQTLREVLRAGLDPDVH